MQKISIAAVIAEFNPLHRGHEYIIKKARELSGASHVLIVLSPNFTQRAEPAVIEKHIRAAAAIHAGADAVVEIPTVYATGNAEVFAKAAVKIVASFPHVTHLVFGTESPDISLIRTIAKTQVGRKNDFENSMTSHIKKGISFDKARCEVIKKLLPKIPSDLIEKTMNTPNNILGIEYLKELVKLQAKVTPIGVQRIQCPSASEIRKKMFDIDTLDRFGSTVLYNLMTRVNENVYNSNTELVNLIRNTHPVTYTELKERAPTKRFSVSRIARLALHSTLGVNKTDIDFLYKHNWLPYTNLLAINTDADALFAALCLNSKTPLVVKGNKIKPRKTNYYHALKQIDQRAELLYESVTGLKFDYKPSFVQRRLLNAPATTAVQPS